MGAPQREQNRRGRQRQHQAAEPGGERRELAGTGRLVGGPGWMELALFRIDPATLRIARWVILDNAERAKVTDGYYAVPYFQDRAERTWLDVITYRGVDGAHPDIVRLEFDWDEVR